MLCVSIGRGRHKHLIAEHKHLCEQGAQLVELRLDYITTPVNLKRLLPDRPCPVVVTCRREQDGGRWAKSEQDRLMLLRAAIADGVEYIDIEEDIASQIPRYGDTKRIISFHDFRQTPDDLEAIYSRMAALDPDIIKIATMAHSMQDNLRVLNLIRNSDVPTVAFCMGEIGTPSRILSGKFGAPFTYATFHHERSLAPGQLSYRQMLDIYNYDELNAETTVYGVIADPIGHSLSPVIHNAAFRSAGLNAVYLPFRVPREDLDFFLDHCQELGIEGLSVTIPHKEAVIRRLGKVDGSVKAIGAVNTIVTRDGDLLGFNTDYRASMDSIDQVMGDESDLPLKGKTALLLGAGGVAKAIAVGLQRRGADIVISSRTLDRATKLAAQVGGRALPWDSRGEHPSDLVINGTPIGMHPNVDDSPYPSQYLRSNMVVFDTVYNPESTLLVKSARKAGCTVITGVDMFVRQAGHQFKLFTKLDAPTDLMRETLKKSIGAVKY